MIAITFITTIMVKTMSKGTIATVRLLLNTAKLPFSVAGDSPLITRKTIKPMVAARPKEAAIPAVVVTVVVVVVVTVEIIPYLLNLLKKHFPDGLPKKRSTLSSSNPAIVVLTGP